MVHGAEQVAADAKQIQDAVRRGVTAELVRDQTARGVECLHRLWAAGQVPRAWLASAPTFNKTTLAWGNTIQALTASQTAVRGAHPTRLLLDEIDEMKLPILEAAQGQPMDRNGVQAQPVMSSTPYGAFNRSTPHAASRW